MERPYFEVNLKHTTSSRITVSRKLIKGLFEMFNSIDDEIPSLQLTADLADLFSALASNLPFPIMPFEESRLHFSCWFLCLVLNAKFTIASLCRGKIDRYQSAVFNQAIIILKMFSTSENWTQFSWTSEVYWLLFYFYEVTKVNGFAHQFAVGGGVDYATRLLRNRLSLTCYSTDLLHDEIIIVMILNNVIDFDAVMGFNRLIIPVLLKYLDTMGRYIFVCSSRMKSQRMVLLSVLSIIFKLSTNNALAYWQVINCEGLQILGSFIGSHPDMDALIRGYLLLINKLKIIKSKEKSFDELMK